MKTDVGGDGFLSPQRSNAAICWLSCLKLCCSPSHWEAFIYLFLSKYIQHFSREPEFLFSNKWALHTTAIIVNLRVSCWELKAPLNDRTNETISLLVVWSFWDEDALLRIFVCACIYLEKKNIRMCAHERTHYWHTETQAWVEKEYSAKILGAIFLNAVILGRKVWIFNFIKAM